MTWPPIKGSYKILNLKGDTAVVTRASFSLPDNTKFNDCKRIAVIGSCVTENVGIDRMIKNLISNGRVRNIIICGKESKGHNVGNALKNLVTNGVDENKRITNATGDDPKLKVNDELIKRFRKQIQNIKVINSENPEAIIKIIKDLPETKSIEDYVLAMEKKPGNAFKNAINARGTEVEWKEDELGYFKIETRNNYIVAKHFMKGKEHTVIIGKTALEINKKIIELGLISELHHALYLGSELKKAELCLKDSKDYEEDTEDVKEKDYLKTTFIEAKNLSDAWIKALTQAYLYGEKYEVGKYNACTLDLPIIVHVKDALAEPVMNPKAPKYEARNKYAKEFIKGKGVEKENEFVYTYYSRLRHYPESIARSEVPNIASNEELLKTKDKSLIKFDQVKEAVKLLKKDPTLRRVVMCTWMPYKDLSLERMPHAPCLVTVQPRINKGRLDFHVMFKSQDLYGGFPSNVYAITKLQKLMADKLGVQVGSYTHYAVSLHIYDNILDTVEELLREEGMIK